MSKIGLVPVGTDSTSESSGVTVITDIGVDDALALVLLDRLAGMSRKVPVSTFGNCKADTIEKNAHDFAAYMQHGWYFHQGTRLPLGGRTTFSAEYFHGDDGLWGMRPPRAVRPFLLGNPVPFSPTISLGPLTQAYALLKKGNLKQITLMGGFFKDKPGTAIRAQANIRMDIDAAEQFFDNCHNLDVRVVPHNVTKQIRWSKAVIDSIPETSTTNVWLKDLMTAWFKKCPYEYFALHDPLAVLLALEPGWARWARSGIRVLRTEHLEGITEMSADNPACDVAVAIDDPEKVAGFIFSSIFTSV